MNEDELNKIETVVGYLKPLFEDLDYVKKRGAWHFLPGVIEEAEEWVSELRERANTVPVSKLAH